MTEVEYPIEAGSSGPTTKDLEGKKPELMAKVKHIVSRRIKGLMEIEVNPIRDHEEEFITTPNYQELANQLQLALSSPLDFIKKLDPGKTNSEQYDHEAHLLSALTNHHISEEEAGRIIQEALQELGYIEENILTRVNELKEG